MCVRVRVCRCGNERSAIPPTTRHNVLSLSGFRICQGRSKTALAATAVLTTTTTLTTTTFVVSHSCAEEERKRKEDGGGGGGRGERKEVRRWRRRERREEGGRRWKRKDDFAIRGVHDQGKDTVGKVLVDVSSHLWSSEYRHGRNICKMRNLTPLVASTERGKAASAAAPPRPTRGWHGKGEGSGRKLKTNSSCFPPTMRPPRGTAWR